MKGRAQFVMALQGMKPHHAAAKWNYVNFQTPTYSAIMMEFTTPLSYGHTTVNVGGIVKDGEIIVAGATSTAKHLATSQDTEKDWPEPTAVLFEWAGKTKDGQNISAEITGELGQRYDRVDVMAHIPGFVKTIVGGLTGNRPFIYQVSWSLLGMEHS
jgi:Svf1-like C-terminal lipocalin-like domain